MFGGGGCRCDIGVRGCGFDELGLRNCLAGLRSLWGLEEVWSEVPALQT